MTIVFLTVIVFSAALTQSLIGFGWALVAMPLLAELLGIQIAAPLVALLALSLESFLVIRYRFDLSLSAIWQLVIGAMVGIPLGILALGYLDETVILTIMGVLVIIYSLTVLSGLKMPRLEGSIWAYGVGLVAGTLAGAYNAPGPPVIIYGQCRRWSPLVFKGNLQAFFVATGVFVVLGHVVAGNLVPAVWRGYLVALAPVGLGILAGQRLEGRVNPEQFRKLVLVALIVIGLTLVF
ncbi:MAG: sulfite exporter TauE/SafE family protein [Chloroflexota bacterium]|nr:sulfite exporter TauE/SafE family protein [Chloroflexota bacterium]